MPGPVESGVKELEDQVARLEVEVTQKVVEVTNHDGELSSLTTDLAMLKVTAEEELGKLSAELQVLNKEVEEAEATKEAALGEIAGHEANIAAEEAKEKDLAHKVGVVYEKTARFSAPL